MPDNFEFIILRPRAGNRGTFYELMTGCHHRVPLQNGGPIWHPDNLRTLCRDCHIRITADQNRRKLTAPERRWKALVDEL